MLAPERSIFWVWPAWGIREKFEVARFGRKSHEGPSPARRIDRDLANTAVFRSGRATPRFLHFSMNASMCAVVARANHARDDALFFDRPAVALAIIAGPYVWPGVGY